MNNLKKKNTTVKIKYQWEILDVNKGSASFIFMSFGDIQIPELLKFISGIHRISGWVFIIRSWYEYTFQFKNLYNNVNASLT